METKNKHTAIMPPNALLPLTQEDKAKNAPYHVGAVVNLSLKDTPYEYTTPYNRMWIFNQGEHEIANDECAGCALAMAIAIREDKQTDPHFHWMMARQRAGQVLYSFGVSLRDLGMTSVKVGSLLAQDSPFSFKNGRDTIADVTKWGLIAPYVKKSAEQASGSILWVTPKNGMDAFDTIRTSITALNKMYNKQHSVVLGLMWDYDMQKWRIDDVRENGVGHAMLGAGWDGDYLKTINSCGKGVGNNGEFMIHRSVINRWAEVFGAFIPIDATREQIDALIASGGKLNDPWRINIVRRFIDVFRTAKLPFSWLVAVLENFLNPRTTGMVIPDGEELPDLDAVGAISPQRLTELLSTMRWETKQQIRRNVRVLCDEFALSYARKNDLCACIRQESQWLPRIVSRPNKNGTRDWGLVQVNDGTNSKGVPFWIGKGAYFTSTDEVLNDTAKSAIFMIKLFKAGYMRYWSSWNSGAYKKWLAEESKTTLPY